MIINAEKILESASIRDILQYEGVVVKGNKCACPVHQGKGLNFSIKITKDGEFGACWSQCGGKVWDSVGLIMELHPELTYPDALVKVADICKLRVEYDNSKGFDKEKYKIEKQEKTKMTELIQSVNDFYWQADSLRNGAIYDLDGRIYDVETITEFGVFFSGEGNVIHPSASEKQWNIAQLIKIGVLKSGEKGIWDVFQNRFVFPIHNDSGVLCGFGGRKAKSNTYEKAPKYVNSVESLIYNKSEVLYGLFQNKKHIKDAGFAFLLEGYTDVVTMFDYGIKNSVASCGTSLTKEQAKLLSRYTDRVVILRDADEAGLKASRRDIEILIESGLHVDIFILPNGDDPDSFLRKYNQNVPFESLIQQTINESINPSKSKEYSKWIFDLISKFEIQNAIIWRVLEEYSDTNLFQKEKATQIASSLLSRVESKSLQEEVCIQLSKKTKIDKKILKDLIKEKSEAKLEKKKDSKLTTEQQQDVSEYGLYIEQNQYFASQDVGSSGWAISNFCIRPIMLVVGAEKSARLVEVTNADGNSFIAAIDSDDFVELTAFKKELARRGNFLYTGKPETFIRIQAKIYKETQNCFQLNTLGWNNAGFWTWGNGISVDGVFKPIDEYGVVEFNKNKYFLPAFSKIQTGSEDEENKFEDEKEFIYVGGKTLGFTEWTQKFVEVHGDNGMMGAAWYCASIFRTIIYNKFNYYPHLNLFGPPGAGKSFMAWSLMAMFGKPKVPFHLVQGTDVGFSRGLAKKRDAITWFDEYSNDVPFKRIEALKAAYDGVGREKGNLTDPNGVTRTKVKAASIISGQQQPTQDVALFKRCISLNFPRFEKSDVRDKIGRDLRDIEQEHRLGQITSLLQSFRPQVETDFARTFDEVRNEVSPMLPKDGMIEDRILNNHLIPLAIVKVLSKHVNFSFSYETLRSWIINNVTEQSHAINNEDELSIWWKMLQYLTEINLLKHYEDFMVQELDYVNISKKDKSSECVRFDKRRTVIFLRFEKAHPLYLEYHKRQYSKNALPESSLKYYLRGCDGFIGEVRAKKFGANQTKYCWAFDVDLIGLNIPISVLQPNEELSNRDIQVVKPDMQIDRSLAPKTEDEIPF